MSYIKITAVVASKCSEKSIGFQTEPIVTEEVMKEAQGMTSHPTLKLSLDGTVVIVSGDVFPPGRKLASILSEILTSANDAVMRRHDVEAANHKHIVDQYAKAYNLTVVD
ncbi:MAG TPA: hypothetical protein VF258_04855 [Luteolibacter sp.]